MITLLLSVGVPLTYLITGAVYARSQVTRLYAQAKTEWRYESMIRESLGWMLAWRVAFWPLAIVLDGIRGPLRSWFMSPVDDRKQRAEKLREDAKTWNEVVYSPVATEAEREMARQLVKLLRDQAEEADL